MKIYYVSEYDTEINDDESWLTGTKIVSMYRIENNELEFIDSFTIPNQQATTEAIDEYFGEFSKQITLVVL